MRIRSYRDEDEIKEVVQRAVEAVDPETYTEDQQRHLENVISDMNMDFVEKNRYSYFVAVSNGEVLGVAGVQVESGEVSGIFVDPKHQGEDIGSRLLEKLEQEALNHGKKVLEAAASTEAVDFYLKNGFESMGEEMHEIKGVEIPVIRMEKRLE